MIGILPLGQGQAALYWSVRNDKIGEWRARPMQAWIDEVGAIYPEAAQLVAGLSREDLTHATYRDVWADPPYQDRIVVIGDAAHGTSPQLGQGTTQAFRDALALTGALRIDAPLAEQLAGYWKTRRARTRYYRHASRLLTPVFQSDWPLLGPLRDLFGGPIGAIPSVRRQSVLTVAGLKTGLWSDDWGGQSVPIE
jgi:2-polyprenyl-6-methoxyphenol hydroxylase-like FAD-dependent oxidoreductase